MINSINKGKIEEERQLITELERGKEEGAVRIYRLYRQQFFLWAKMQHKVNEDSCADIFQEAVMDLFLQARKGKLQEIACSLKTYLFAIGKNLLLKTLSNEKRRNENTGLLTQFPGKVQNAEEASLDERQQFIMKVLANFAKPCKSIVRLFYFNAYSMSEIAVELKYKNEDVVKSQKSRCIKELKRLVKEGLKTLEAKNL